MVAHHAKQKIENPEEFHKTQRQRRKKTDANQKIENPDEWDMFFTRSIIEPEPLAMSLFVYPGWWDTGGKNKYMQALARETEPKARAQAWENLQLLMYEEIPWILTGKHFFTGAVATKLRAVDPAFSWRANSWVFWNAWFAE